MTKQPTDYLKEALRIARSAGLFIIEKGREYRVYRRTPTRPVYLGRRGNPAGLCSFIKRCAGTK